MDGFHVDVTALSHASDGIRRTVEAMHERSVQELSRPSSAFGHDRLTSVMAEFCSRWDDGIQHLCSDAREISERLDHCAQAYRQAEQTAHEQLHAVLDEHGGPDPAAQP